MESPALLFAREPDGLSALEYNLIENNHRHNTSHAIKRFIRSCRYGNGTLFVRRYRRLFGKAYKAASREYVHELTELCCRSRWRYDRMDNGPLFYTVAALVANKLSKNRQKKAVRKLRDFILMLWGQKGYFTALSREKFLCATRNYTSALLRAGNRDNCGFAAVKNMIPAKNAARYLNYFENCCAVVLDRDPRDIYIADFTNAHSHCDPETFCRWYRITHGAEPGGPVLHLWLEELVYDYANAERRLAEYVGLDAGKHTRRYSRFDPRQETERTRLWLRHPELNAEIRYIEQELAELLCPYNAEKEQEKC